MRLIEKLREIRRKLAAAIANAMTVIICVGPAFIYRGRLAPIR
jgi:triosephosphate isomerase